MALLSVFFNPSFEHLLWLSLLFGMVSMTMQKTPKKQLIEKINQMNSTWSARDADIQNPKTFAPFNRVVESLEVLNPGSKGTPDFFDARIQWKHCSNVIGHIRDQGQCDSSWAVATASMLSDRTCIETGGSEKVDLSGEDLLTCCKDCRVNEDDPCEGGSPETALKFWSMRGIVSGGEFNITEGCKSYSKESMTGAQAGDCITNCTNSDYKISYLEDKNCGSMTYTVPAFEKKIRQEIFNNGPVLTTMIRYEDITFYEKGIYKHLLGDKEGLHHVKIIGWGEKGNQKYWLVVNSQGKKFGENGIFKILRNVNECEIEDNVLSVKISEELPKEQARGANHGNVFQPLFVNYVFVTIMLVCIYIF